ncbi:DMT family transporter [Methanoculleus sp. Wushi-C6]|uniref:DMT family transporter n=1 Tax=Methanoculleus caldifontis TaxID=2651577 RepID=A0ABU3X3Y6_9EURY|nr:DMT family transporter [Methanoculleus sp. Wushi-C6]MDV2482121.1 DMT family transporter [Methanoculleus sp. Wushi-C6]
MFSQYRTPVLCALVTAVLIGGSAPFTKLLIGGAGPLALAALVSLGSGSGALLFSLAGVFSGTRRNHVEAPLARSDLPWLIGVTLFGGLLAPVTLILSLPATPAATAALLLNFEAVATTLIAAAVFGEWVSRRIWVALGCITAACIVLTQDPSGGIGLSLAALGILLTCLFWAVDNNLGQRLSARDPLRVISVKGIGSGTVVLLLAFAAGEHLPDPPTAIAAMAIGFLCYGGLTSILFLLALRGIGAARAGSLLAVSPFFGVFFSLLLFAEVPAEGFYVALPVMALGAWLLVTEEHSHHHRHEATVHEHRHRHDDLHHDHAHEPGDPTLNGTGEHSHPHAHAGIVHEHPHQPDIHHRHLHRR